MFLSTKNSFWKKVSWLPFDANIEANYINKQYLYVENNMGWNINTSHLEKHGFEKLVF